MQAHTTADLLTPLSLLSPSPTNPRTRMSEAEIVSLAESIAAHGVMQPVLARRLPAAADGAPPLEIVAGHRRWRACNRLAAEGRNPHGDSVPTLVHELTDAQVLAMQLVENIQREDLHPLDEAEHYRRMREDPAAPASVEAIAQAGKVSPSRVYERLSLLQLVPAAREAFLADKLSLKTALQVARMPAALQAEATQHLSDWGGEPMAPKAAAAFIRDRYMLRLAQAPFKTDDATLLPDAGACGTCPKRTGSNPQLFGDITDADTCTDPQCFAAKKDAQRTRLVDELGITGYTVLRGDQARDACTPDGRDLKPGRHLLEQQVPYSLGDPTLKIVDVLTQAKTPNSHVQVIDHPGNPVLVYSVYTAELETSLRKIKAHRQQLDKATAKTATASSASAPASAPAAKSVAAAPAAASGADDGAPGADASEAGVDAERKAFLAKILEFTPPPTVAGRYGHQTAHEYERTQADRAEGILAAAKVATHVGKDGAEGLPSFRMAHMICALLWWGESYLSFSEATQLAGVDWPQQRKDGSSWPTTSRDDELQLLWDLPDDQAERLALTLLASQEHDGSSPLRYFAGSVCQGLGIDFSAIENEALQLVRERMQLGVVESGEPTKAKRAGKPVAVRYRCPDTGSSWTGRGLMPVWLKRKLEQGHSITEFELDKQPPASGARA